MSKILVTGANGFIGSHLCELLLDSGYDVKALVEYNFMNSYGWLEGLDNNQNIEIISGDIRDDGLCKKLCNNVDIVLNLAALVAIPYSYIAPTSYFETNVSGTHNLLKAALESGCTKFIQTSTSEVYGTAITVPIDESHPLQPQSPYSASKISSDMLARSYYYTYGLPVVIARPFNTYGPRQSARAIIPTIIAQLAAGHSEIKLGDLNPTRNMNYVTDTCSGFISLVKSNNVVGDVFNIGSEDEISIGNLARMIIALMGSNAEIIEDDIRIRPEKSEVMRLSCNANKIKAITGHSNIVSLKSGLEKTIKWFLDPSNLNRYKTGYNI